MYYEGKTSDITVLELEGAPHDIVFIADPHLRPSNLDHTRDIVDKINALRPSLVLIGGDFVYGEGEDFSLQEVWSEIDAPVYAVLGNHDYKSGITASSAVQKVIAVRDAKLEPDDYDVSNLRDGSTDLAYADALAATLEANGVHVLRNEYQEMVIDGKAVTLVGVDDGWAGMADPPVVQNTDSFVIYLIHEPDCRAEWDADLILAGHTHGGQFAFPGMDRLTTAGIIDLSGGVAENGTLTYITRGLGTSNLDIELRFFASPEIVVINPSNIPPE